MMAPVFLDTSALFAVLDADDKRHSRAGEAWQRLLVDDDLLICTNYVLVETFALVQARLGMEAVRTLQERAVPVMTLHWIDEQTLARSVAALLTAGRRALSLVDCSSFEVMRSQAISTAFAFDPHFSEQGFDLIPESDSG